MTAPVSILECASVLAVSRLDLGRFIRECPDFPIVERGGPGKPYKLDVEAVRVWINARRAKIEAPQASSDELDDAKKRLQIEVLSIEVAKAKGELVDVNELAIAQDRAMTSLREELLSVPDRMLRQSMMTREALTELRRQIEMALTNCADRLERLVSAPEEQAA